MKRYNVVSSDRRIGTEMHADSDGRFVLYSDHLAAIEQARRNGAVEARNELLGGISLAKTPLTLDECIIMYRDAVRRMRQAEAKAEQARKDDKQHIEILEHNLAAAQESYRNCVKDHNTVVDDNTQLRVDLAAAQAYATTFAVSIHKQHYAEDAPNWQPLPDLVGLLTQIDNMYAGLRNDLEALKVENKRLVGLPLASLRAEREQAIAEVECLWVAIQSHCSAATIKAIESELESK